jgi:DNA-binding transcriptional LysR family regulator
VKSVQEYKANGSVWGESAGNVTPAAFAPAREAAAATGAPRTAASLQSGGPQRNHVVRAAKFSVVKRPAMTNIDLKLMAIVKELHKTRSVSQTAENLQLSQSTISMSLAKLRRHFNDPLFVRTSSGMEPTPHALQIMTLLKNAESFLQSALECRHIVFDPASSERTFHVCSTDIAQITLLPAIMKRLKEVGPGISVDLVDISDNSPRLLESGEIDLAIGFIPPMGAGFYQQRLFKDRFVCAVRTGHPRIREHLSVDQFQREGHVVVATSGTGHGIIEESLEAKKLQRRIGLRVPSFLGLAPILAATDFIAVLPEQLAQFFAATGKVKVFALPFSIPPYFITQHWHERYRQDPANIWFRGLLADLLLR